MKKLSSGHLAVDVFPTSSEDDHLFLSKNFDLMVSKQIFKLHCQFGHCSGQKFLSMLAQASKKSASQKKSVENVCESCIVCAKFG